MDAFSQLTGGGGIRFDRKRFSSDLQLFKADRSSGDASSSAAASGSKSGAGSSSSSTKVHMPSELDFFGSGSGGAAAAAAGGLSEKAKGKRKRIEAEHEAADAELAALAESEEAVTPANLQAFLKANRIRVKGTDVPLPISSWAELEARYEVPRYLAHNLLQFGWKRPTPIQKGAMSVMLEKRDLLAGAPTGSGKTLAFLLPILHHLRKPAAKTEGIRAVIVSPTRELAQQIYEQLKKLGEGRPWRICVLSANKPAASAEETVEPEQQKKYDVLITTPLRLVHAIETKEVDLSNVRHLVLDEADRLLELNFFEQTDTILAACSHGSLRKALFSATLPAGVEEMARTFMVDECRVIVGTKDAANERIDQRLLFVGGEEGKLHALRSLIQEGALKPPVLLFVQSIERAKELFHELVYDGLHVDVIHSERPKAQREGVIAAFKRGDVWVLICTELMARGIDFKGVRLVINYDFPQTVQSYIHRIGRTGRAGKDGEAITMFTKEDAPYLRTVVNIMKQSGCEVADWMLKLDKPSKKAKRALKKKPVERKDVSSAAGHGATRKESNKKREMIEASKRRKAAATATTAAAPVAEQEQS